jgi:uncharacterized protein YbaR (Trm112 family)
MTDAISADLLEILVCPETHQRLRLAEAGLLARLQGAQREGKLLNRAGEAIAEGFEAALVREDGAFAYRITEQIPVMLIDEAIPLDPPAPAAG